MSTPPAIRCQGLVKTYSSGDDKISALRGLDLEVESGELMILAGPSGCGKTTLLSIIGSILDYDEGDCEIYGNSFTHMNKEEKTAFRAKNIGFVFQAVNLFPTLTAAENVAIPLIINGMTPQRAIERGEELLAYMGLQNRVRAYPAALSGGQQQRVAIARGLIHTPKVVLCDEPTSAIDGETGYKIMRLMKRIALATKQTLLIVTHDSRIFSFADRIAKMEDGRIVKITSSYKKFEEER